MNKIQVNAMIIGYFDRNMDICISYKIYMIY